MPKYPVYIISKGRWASRLTAKSLDAIGCPFRIVVEPQEYDQYAEVVDPAKILVLPFSNLGLGSIPARNWVWEHSIAEGHKRHWILDDNIRHFYRFDGAKRRRVSDSAIFDEMEGFVDRYSNVPMAAMQYHQFAGTASIPTRTNRIPFILNNRCYSCILLHNGIPDRWRGRYNEDTDLSLRLLKQGWCTMTFYAFMCGKVATMTMRGGNTDKLYQQDKGFDGRLEMARSLVRQHPDVTKIVWKWGRWQHSVDYRPFKGNRLMFTQEWLALHPELQEAANGPTTR